MKILRYAIWLVWLSGVLMMVLSFYLITNLSSSFEYSRKSTPRFSDFSLVFGDEVVDVTPKITIFTSPDPFSNDVWFKMALSVSSWIQLSQNVSVVLFSRDPYVHKFAEEFESSVSVDPNVDFSFRGTPFFHSMVARTRAYKTDIAVLVDREAILFPDFISTLSYAHKFEMGWFLFALPRNITQFSYQPDENGHHWLDEDVKAFKMQQMQEYLSQVGHLNYGEERMLMAWNNVDSPLHIGVLPPFLYKKGVHNQWIINEIMFSNIRFIFDATSTISSSFETEGDPMVKHLVEHANDGKAENVSWEYDGNRHLAALYGSLFYRKANFTVIPKLSKCMKIFYFLDPYGNPIYPPVSTKIVWKSRLLHSWRKMLTKSCAVVNDTQRRSYQWTENILQPLEELYLPFALEKLVSINADFNKTIVLGIAGSSYKEMLMSWVCRLRQLQISNFLVCALDQETYEFSLLQGLPVYKDSIAPQNISFHDCHFGTECFQKVTKVKSRLVLQILKMGYNVLLSDVDVYWFQDPRPLLYSYGPGVLAAQSDEYNKKGAINMPRRLNSGFYFARSDIPTISAMERVVKHAAKSNLSEQPSFYDTLCGKGGTYRISKNKCLEPKTNLTVHFLDRNLFPNGAYRDFWETKNVRAACVKAGCIVLHNNWISGRQKKLERQIHSGLWEYDASTRMCHYDSHNLCRGVMVCTHFLCVPQSTNGRLRNRRGGQPSVNSFSLDRSFQRKESVVRLIHAGGKEELYSKSLPASHLMRKHPSMCIGRPDVFRNPHQSLLNSDEKLELGHKYYLLPEKTAQKLKRRHASELILKGSPELDEKDYGLYSTEISDESILSVRESYISKSTKSPKKLSKREQKKHFVPPFQRTPLIRGSGWEPELNSVQELSS